MSASIRYFPAMTRPSRSPCDDGGALSGDATGEIGADDGMSISIGKGSDTSKPSNPSAIGSWTRVGSTIVRSVFGSLRPNDELGTSSVGGGVSSGGGTVFDGS